MSQDYETKQSDLRASRDAPGDDRTPAEDPLLELARIVHKNKQSGAHVSGGRVGSTDYFAGLDDVSDDAADLSGRQEPTFGQGPAGVQTETKKGEPAARGEPAGGVTTDPVEGPVPPAVPATGRSSSFSALRPGTSVGGFETEPARRPQEAEPDTGEANDLTGMPVAGSDDLGKGEPSTLAPSLSIDLEQNLTAELEDELIGALRQSVDESKPAAGYQQFDDENAFDFTPTGASAAPVQPDPFAGQYRISSETTSLDAAVKDSLPGPQAVNAAESLNTERENVIAPDAEPEPAAAVYARKSDLDEAVRPPEPVQRPRIDENDLFAALNPVSSDKERARDLPRSEEEAEPAGIDALFADLDFPPPSERKAPEVRPSQAEETASASDIDDMTWPAAAAAVPQSDADETPPPPEGYDLDAVARAMQESDPSLTGAGVLPPHSAAEKGAIPQAREKSRRGLVVAAGVLGVAAIGAAGFFLFDGDSVVVPSGPPPVISGLQEPLKIFPEDSAAPPDDQAAKLDYSRVDGTGVSGPDRLVLPESPQPAELPPAPAGTSNSAELAPGTPKRVRTVIVRPDGTFVSEDEAGAPAAGTPAAAAPVAAAPEAVPEPAEPAPVATPPVVPDTETVQSEPVPSLPEPAVPEPAATQTPTIADETPEPVAAPEVTEPAAPVPGVLPRRKPEAPAQVAIAQPAPTTAPSAPAAQNGGPLDLSQQASAPSAPAPQASAPAAAPVSTSTASIPSGTYIVQVTSQRSEAAANDAYSGLQRRYPAILGNRNAVIVSANVEDRGVFYRARIPTGSRAEAISLCESLQAAGGDCFVRRQP
jgi:hypothetical protein